MASGGFTAPKILWMQKNEPENFKKVVKIMLPKDYLAYRLSGSFCTDVSDASGMLLLDVKNRSIIFLQSGSWLTRLTRLGTGSTRVCPACRASR